jgi:hypothetical protein
MLTFLVDMTEFRAHYRTTIKHKRNVYPPWFYGKNF